jgi:hypothetical protein
LTRTRAARAERLLDGYRARPRSRTLLVAAPPPPNPPPPPSPPTNPLLLSGCATRFGALTFPQMLCDPDNPSAGQYACCRTGSLSGQCTANTNQYTLVGTGTGNVTMARVGAWSYTLSLAAGTCTYTNGAQVVNLFCGAAYDFYFGTLAYGNSVAGGTDSGFLTLISPEACAVAAPPAERGSCAGASVAHRYIAASAQISGTTWLDGATASASAITLYNNVTFSSSQQAVLFSGPSLASGAGGYGWLAAPLVLPSAAFSISFWVRFDFGNGARAATPSQPVRAAGGRARACGCSRI